MNMNVSIHGQKVQMNSYQDASSRGVTIPPLCPTPMWQADIISKENNCFYLLSCWDIEIHPPKSVLDTSSDSEW